MKFMHFLPYSQRIDEFSALLSEGSYVLDLACGPGNTARQLLGAGKKLRLLGVDLSEEMVLAARRNVPEADFRVQDLREIAFPSHTFDAVVMSFCIVHLLDQEAREVITRVCEWLKPGGLIYLSFMEGKQAGFETTSFSSESIYFNYYDADVIVAFLKQRRLTVKQITKQGYQEADGSMTTDVFIIAQAYI
jgi:ubiquinone/menaquinone biosynthesis C-methylase UbiE